MNWIIENKEWIFSGIGVFIISVVWVVIQSVYSRKSSNTAQNSASAATSIIASKLTHPGLTIYKILKDIHNQPPYQQDEATKNYLGVRIRFSGVLKHVLKKEGDIVGIVMNNPKEPYPDIFFELNIKDYPEFKTMRKHNPLVVEGTLAKIDVSISSLKDIKVIS